MIQLITISKIGGMRGLDHRGQGIDLARFGRATKKRVSEIVWNEKEQMWCLVGLFGSDIIDRFFYIEFKGAHLHPDGLMFKNYDDAVWVEVDIFQERQLLGLC